MARTWIIALLIATRFRRTGRGLFPFLCSSSSCYWQKDFNTIEKEREREGEIVFCYPSELSKISKTNLLSRRGRAAASHWFVKVDIKGSIRISLSFFLCAFLNFFSLPPFYLFTCRNTFLSLLRNRFRFFFSFQRWWIDLYCLKKCWHRSRSLDRRRALPFAHDMPTMRIASFFSSFKCPMLLCISLSPVSNAVVRPSVRSLNDAKDSGRELKAHVSQSKMASTQNKRKVNDARL